VLTITFQLDNGLTQDGVVASMNSERVRVLVPGQTDAVEFRRSPAGRWITEDGRTADIAFIVCEAPSRPHRCMHPPSRMKHAA
jgi:hypothetical protein